MTRQKTDLSQLTGLELLRMMTALPEQPPNIGKLLGMEVGAVEYGTVEFSTVSRPDFANPLGNVHGGICATLLDSVMGCAVHTTLEPATGYSTLELKVNYLRTVPTSGVRLTAHGTIIHTGRSTATAEGKVFDDQGRLVAHGTTTCLIHR
ncbi:PaaI family thioesterase [Hoyosella sp. YIM 151337]|uniref:PaaI family thioesterase n=1 Tax=Hoyosella sp. YIM 151337 TaxID=2992742 RepID=UPI0022355D18|nr:PaaI family thioesterase [Hoyosella sp. YIM 151337]MCW4353684.1 PaaI family thioesterase [Hoyosella sp. YIM 151337]